MGLRDIFFYLTGIGFLALANAKYILRGYATPKTFPSSEIERCIAYDIQVVDKWLQHLVKYTHDNNYFAGKNVLELGPGSDLGIGIYLLSLGVAKYNACDVTDLEKTTSDKFYQCFFERLKIMNIPGDIVYLKDELHKAKNGNGSNINYVVRKDFNFVSALGSNTIDLVFSQAAFEHFDDIDATVAQLSAVCKPGAVIVAVIDLKTHSRWIRDKDPNNIYRYGEGIYKAFWCRGFPNRIRPFQYRKTFEHHGWEDITISPLKMLDGANCGRMHRHFRDDVDQMDYLSILFCARKK